MKSHNGWILECILLLSVFTAIRGAPGCQDNSLHLACCSIDYKNWHYVACNCPCELSYTIRPDGRCSQCEHLRRAIRLVHPEAPDPTTLLNIVALQAATTRMVAP